ncbi:MAG: metal-dependent hydrolase [Candidatus Methanofastidiosum methylothiophilum]|uniref:Metal-dependent hydrolase n=1 Tax=Candidatus Methanofastidiosum methylothiophilum TaxID=1705564 RepID=A0A150IHX5_9EURY|nr:MAG: metal-dependent hydrolase [Candidatus Methanofastidiosum methylthiophilus]KYC46629.1 MAG: metal-dependent hydrolase [Candidatus Methanofastidiosum methylthiophilus]KYC49117.1 MAG: metal-dependent hydrolase [Candidatus Methanofastidiosum methylthiophilus]
MAIKLIRLSNILKNVGKNFNIIKVGLTNCYLLKSDSCNILIDTGYKGKAKIILDYLETNGINAKSIKLIILTHGHYDHIGNAIELKKVTGAKILIHKNELPLLRSGVTDSQSTKPLNIWGKILLSKISSIDTTFEEIKPDIIIESEFDLNSYGIKGRIISTPGHSKGSISIILDSGDAFIGDLGMNGLPLRIGPGEPIFGEDISEIYKSWDKLVKNKAKSVYPSHGESFDIEVIKKILSTKGLS